MVPPVIIYAASLVRIMQGLSAAKICKLTQKDNNEVLGAKKDV
jgi:hypothetical protein